MAGRPYELHEHAVLTSRRSPGETIAHAHEGGSEPHRHPDTGPATYGRARGQRHRAKPHGEQLTYVAPTDEERCFTVVFVEGYTPGHATAGISRERYEAERAAFRAAMEADATPTPAVERLVRDFRLTVRYEVADAPDGEG